MLKRLFGQKYTSVAHTVATAPQESVPVDDYADLPGSYTVFIDASEVGQVNDVSARIMLKPHPGSGLVRYVDAPLLVDTDGSPLWSAELPVCAGMVITLRQKTGVNCKVTIYVWRDKYA
jgi:hypothetical protein